MKARKIVACTMLVLGIGVFVLAFSHYTPAGAEDVGGWAESCRYMMAVGAMIATGGKLLL